MRVQNETNAARAAASGKALPGAVTIGRLTRAAALAAERAAVRNEDPECNVVGRVAA